MIAVVGGGAAGLMAAVSAAESGAKTVLIEKNKILGKKLRITGKGRCNITNACPTQELFENIPKNPKFLYSAIYNFTNYDVIDFFERLGVKTKVERGMRVFPESDKAADVVRALENAVKKSGVSVITANAEGIITKNNSLAGIKTDKGIIKCSAAVIATGGKSYPKTGSDGSGYDIIRRAGHSITPLTPSLVPMETLEDTMPLMGLSLKNVKISVCKQSGETVYTDFGEMLFTHYGLTGPTVLSSSCHISRCTGGAVIKIDLKPALSANELDARILRDFKKYCNRNFENSLSDLLPQKMIGYIVSRSGIDPYKKVNCITHTERVRLGAVIKNLEFHVKRLRSIDEAIITSGGVNVREINASTMESKIVSGLFFAGEIIDTDAYTGGFNLQIAFSTGRLAGKKAAEREEL